MHLLSRGSPSPFSVIISLMTMDYPLTVFPPRFELPSLSSFFQVRSKTSQPPLPPPCIIPRGTSLFSVAAVVHGGGCDFNVCRAVVRQTVRSFESLETKVLIQTCGVSYGPDKRGREKLDISRRCCTAPQVSRSCTRIKQCGFLRRYSGEVTLKSSWAHPKRGSSLSSCSSLKGCWSVGTVLDLSMRRRTRTPPRSCMPGRLRARKSNPGSLPPPQNRRKKKQGGGEGGRDNKGRPNSLKKKGLENERNLFRQETSFVIDRGHPRLQAQVSCCWSKNTLCCSCRLPGLIILPVK